MRLKFIRMITEVARKARRRLRRTGNQSNKIATPPKGSPCPRSVGKDKGPLKRTKAKARRGGAPRSMGQERIKELRSNGLLQRIRRDKKWKEAKEREIEARKRDKEKAQKKIWGKRNS